VVHALHFAVTVMVCTVAVPVLCRTRWWWRMPRTAVVIWQSVGLSWVLSLVGLALSLVFAPRNRGIVPGLYGLARGADVLRVGSVGALVVGLVLAVLPAGALVVCLAEAVRLRRRHRDLLTLVGRDDPAVPGARVIDHAAPAAYCLPGRPVQVVLSAGTLRLLRGPELAAVLAHERAHGRERHDLVLLPFTALRRVFGWLRPVRVAVDAVALLVEMCADDRARREHGDAALASALLRFGAGPPPGTPAGALGVADVALRARLSRLLAPPPAPRPVLRAAALLAALLLVMTPISLFVLPM
jgi:Zn-dependent protease with chaperone function